jgi:hypothetical protein
MGDSRHSNYRTQLRSALKGIDLYVIRWGARRKRLRLNSELLGITTGGAKGTEHALRLNPELRELAPLPDLDLVTEIEPAPVWALARENQFTFKTRSASPLFVMALLVVVVAVVVMVDRTYANTSNPEAAANAFPGGSGNGLMVAGGNGLTGKTYPPQVVGGVISPLLYLTERDRMLERQTDQLCKRRGW